MSEYSIFDLEGDKEYLCPICGNILLREDLKGDGWDCECGEFIQRDLAINPYKGISNQHKQNRLWR